jgi:hypothetical protein
MCFLSGWGNNLMINTKGRRFYKKKATAEDARTKGEVTVKRENKAGHKIYINKKVKK